MVNGLAANGTRELAGFRSSCFLLLCTPHGNKAHHVVALRTNHAWRDFLCSSFGPSRTPPKWTFTSSLCFGNTLSCHSGRCHSIQNPGEDHDQGADCRPVRQSNKCLFVTWKLNPVASAWCVSGEVTPTCVLHQRIPRNPMSYLYRTLDLHVLCKECRRIA